MGKIKLLLGASILLLSLQANAALIPIDGDLFTVVPNGPATWSDNNLTLSIRENESGDASRSQTPIISTSALPENIIGISFEFSESAAMMDYFSFSYSVQNLDGVNQGQVNLVSGSDIGPDPLTRFVRSTTGLGEGTVGDYEIEFLGSEYSPFSLIVDDRDLLSSYPVLWLDFLLINYDGPLEVTLYDINWIVCSEFPGGGATEGCFPGPGEFPGQVPAPPAIWLFGTGLIGLIGFTKRRKAA